MEIFTIDTTKDIPTRVFQDEEMIVSALGVPHGIVPALAYRVDIGDKHLVFSGDQNGSQPAFIPFAKGADLLIMHFAIPEHAGKIAKRLHATPSVVGQIAPEVKPDILVLSHFMRRSLNNLSVNLSVVKERYSGKLILAEDLQCIPL